MFMRLLRCALFSLPVGLLLFSAACHKAASAGLAARVGNETITMAKLDQVYKYQTLGRPQKVSANEEKLMKLSLLNRLIDRRILMSYAAALHIAIPPAELNQRVAQDEAMYPKIPPAVVREDALATLTEDHLYQREISSRVQVTPAQIEAFYNAHRGNFQIQQPEYHVAEIEVTSQPSPVNNLASNKAGTPAQARQKIRMIAGRLRQGADFAQLAQQYSENPNNAASGGDLGIITLPELSSQQVQPQLRNAILKLKPGQISPVVQVFNQGVNRYYIFKLLEYIPAGRRQFTDPNVQAAIRQALVRTRQQLLRAAFLTALRDRARVHNYYAERLLRQAGVKLP